MAVPADDPSLRAELVTKGRAIDRVIEKDDAKTVIYYMGEQSGSLAPCGCADDRVADFHGPQPIWPNQDRES